MIKQLNSQIDWTYLGKRVITRRFGNDCIGSRVIDLLKVETSLHISRLTHTLQIGSCLSDVFQFKKSHLNDEVEAYVNNRMYWHFVYRFPYDATEQ